MWLNPQFTSALVAFTEEILNEFFFFYILHYASCIWEDNDRQVPEIVWILKNNIKNNHSKNNYFWDNTSDTTAWKVSRHYLFLIRISLYSGWMQENTDQ